MHLQIRPFTVHKQFALTISRGTASASTNVWLILQQDGLEGWGEATPFSVGRSQTTEGIVASLEQVAPALASLTPFDQQAVQQILHEQQMPSAARAALDLAMHDWIGKRLGVPLWRLWGGDRQRIVPTSVTIGISSPEQARARLHHWQQSVTVRAVKVKLGSPAGTEADQAMLRAILADISPDVKVSVDANGGWNTEDAIAMSHWLADQGVTYIEQPLAHGAEDELPRLYRESPLPIFVDESCFTSRAIPKLGDRVHGINIKLMKSGGLTEAQRMIHTARAHGLQVMFGCYSDSALANTAAAQLAPFADHLDLDSHLNLKDDPFVGATLEHGCLIPPDQPGLGVRWRPSGDALH
ncbi:MAG: dipeptide epimerase [Synechococcales bacterium]|nr:dipeptide epimerase [Synechococcales bacterium]